MSTVITRERKHFVFLAAAFVIMLTIFFPSTAFAAKDDDTTKKSSKTQQETTISQDLDNLDISMKDGKLTNPIEGNQRDADVSFTTIFQKTKVWLLAFSGLATLLFIGLGIKQAIAIGASSGNPNARSAALSGLMWIIVGAIIAGSITTVIAIAWNFGK